MVDQVELFALANKFTEEAVLLADQEAVVRTECADGLRIMNKKYRGIRDNIYFLLIDEFNGEK